jgi:hypothetical protein
MARKRVVVVVRHLPGSVPVASFIKEQEVDMGMSQASADDYLEGCADKYITTFKEKFVEFNKAQFYTYLLDN